MILRFYKTILIGKKRRLLIEFKENKYQILSTFLESDVSPFEEWIKSDFDRVISGESEYEEVNGNVCCAEISPKTTKIYDNLAEDAMGNWCEVDTKELRQLIEEWCDKVREFRNEYHNQISPLTDLNSSPTNIRLMSQSVSFATREFQVQINRYDGEGLRHEMKENGRLIKFLYNEDREVVAEETSNGTITRYIRGLGIISSDSEEAKTYYHYVSDEQGSITHVLSEDAEILNHYSYAAFGNIIEKTEKVENCFCYNGEMLDPVTQQYYLRARFYNPVIGRFTQEDTYYGDGLNLYQYCQANPVGYVDPSGHNCGTTQSRYNSDKEQHPKANAAGGYQSATEKGNSKTSYGKSSGKIGDFTELEGSTVDEILDRIPDEAVLRELYPVQGGATEGFEFKWVQNGQTYRVRVHNVDPSAPVGSNAYNGWVVRAQRGRRYFDPTINDFREAKYFNPNGPDYDEVIINDTHIPILDPYQN